MHFFGSLFSILSFIRCKMLSQIFWNKYCNNSWWWFAFFDGRSCIWETKLFIFHCHQISTRPFLVNKSPNVNFAIHPSTVLIVDSANIELQASYNFRVPGVSSTEAWSRYWSTSVLCFNAAAYTKERGAGSLKLPAAIHFLQRCKSRSADSESELNDPLGLLYTFLSLVKIESFKKTISSILSF